MLRVHMAAAMPPPVKPAPREASPLFTPLGYSRHNSERWLHLRVGDEVRTYRPSQALGMAFLLGIYPDHDHWARMYPSRYYNGQRLDWRAAVSHIIRLCIEAGEYTPPVDGADTGAR